MSLKSDYFVEVKLMFGGYMKTVEEKIKKLTASYDSNFKNCPSGSEYFYRQLFNVMRKFLNEKETKQLFIYLPIHELGAKQADFEEAWKRLQEVIADTLCLATSEKQKELVNCPELILTRADEVYYCHNEVKLKKCTSPFFYQIVKTDRRTEGLRPKPFGASNLDLSVGDAIHHMFESNKNCTLRMKGMPRLNDNNICDQRTHKQIENNYNRINSYIQNGFETQYESAGIIGFNDSAKRYERSYSNDYFDSPVSFSTKADDQILNNEIVCFVGDMKYRDVWYDVQRKIGQGEVKKAIYIGTYLEEFKESERNKIYHFSIREMYRYFANDEFPTLTFQTLGYPLLNDKLTELNSILDEIGVDDEQLRKAVMNRIMSRFLCLSYKKANDNDIEYLESWLFDNLNLSPEQTYMLLDWYTKLYTTSNDKNPKANALSDLPKNKRSLVIPSFSFKDNLKKFIRSKNNCNNVYVFDIVNNAKNPNIQNVKDVLMYLPLGEIHFVSYAPLSVIEDYFKIEPLLCNGDYRKSQLDNIEYKMPTAEDSLIKDYNSLENYFVFDLLEEMVSSQQQERAVSHYEITFDDRTQTELSGDVIYNNCAIPISDLYTYKEEYPANEITYYSTPKNFAKILEIVKDFPIGQDVAYYSKLWKKILADYCHKEYGDDAKKMQKEQFPFLPKNRMNEFLDTDSLVFPHKFSALVRAMIQLQLVDNQMAKFLMSAYKAKQDSTSLGVELKKALYEYKLTTQRNDFLKKFDEKADKRGEKLNSDLLLDECLSTKVYKEIQKTN